MKKSRFYYGESLSFCKMHGIFNETAKRFDVMKILNKQVLPRITICGIWDTDTNKMYFGVSRCSHKDQFVKSFGAKISQGRAEKAPYRVVDIVDTKSVSETFIRNAKEIETEVSAMKYPIVLN